MKNILLIVSLLVVPICTFAQDYIYQTDKTQIKCQVIAIEVTDITYKKWDNLNGPTYTILKTDVLMIQYANGSSDFFTVPTAPAQQQSQPEQQQQPVQQQQQYQEPVQQQQPVQEQTYTPPPVYTPPAYTPPLQPLAPPHDFLSSYTETDYTSYLGVGLMYTRFVPGSAIGFYTHLQSNFAINGGVTDADSSSSIILYFGGGIVVGWIEPDGSTGVLGNVGLDYEAITGNLMYNAKIYTFIDSWMFGFKWAGFVTNGGGPYFGMFAGYQFKL